MSLRLVSKAEGRSGVVRRKSSSRFRASFFRLPPSAFRLALLAACIASRASHADSAGDSIAREGRAVFEKCRDAVVKIQAVDDHGTLAGSGFFIDPNGTLYTSYTIGGETRDIDVLLGGRRIRAERLLSDSRSGIA